MQHTPIPAWHIHEGGNYWASWGSKGWTAITIISAKRKWAQVQRVDPKTNKPKRRNSKVRLDEMVKRDPKLKGKDKPTSGPADIFAGLRASREAEAEPEPVEAEVPSPVAEVELTPAQRERQSWPQEQWNEFHRSVWDKAFGDGSWALQADHDDW